MIAEAIDKVVGYFSPLAQLRRTQARKVLRSYQGAETTRLTGNKKPKNQAADQELLGPWGADAMRSWARSLVRDNGYAWNIVDTIVSNVIGSGITAQSAVEKPSGADVEDVNLARDKVWQEWCEVCDINGELTFLEIQALCQREIVEAGEVLIRLIKTPGKQYRGISRPVPLAIELIEADRLSLNHDTYTVRATRETGNRIIRGIELDDKGKAIAYWLYPEHPNSPYTVKNQIPERVPANEILHLYRKDRVGQSRGISWFAPIMSDLRDLATYKDNELQASAISSCFMGFIKSDNPTPGMFGPAGTDSTDQNGNQLDYFEPGLIARLNSNESIEFANPGRPNGNSQPWISLILRGACAGTGTNYEAVSKDFSNTSYSSSRTSKLEDKPRCKRWTNYMIWHCCQPIWDEFFNAAAREGLDNFPTSTELLEDRRAASPVEWQRPEQPWVDPEAEQRSAEGAVNSHMSTLQEVVGSRGGSWRSVLYQQAKERKLRLELGLQTEAERTAEMMAKQTEANTGTGDAGTNVASQALNGAQVTSLVDVITQVGTGAMPKDTAKPVLQAAFPAFSPELIDSIIDPIEPGTISADGVPTGIPEGSTEQPASGVYMGLSTQQWNRNRKAVQKTLDELAAGTMKEASAREFLKAVGMPQESIDVFISDALDGVVDSKLPVEEVAANG